MPEAGVAPPREAPGLSLDALENTAVAMAGGLRPDQNGVVASAGPEASGQDYRAAALAAADEEPVKKSSIGQRVGNFWERGRSFLERKPSEDGEAPPIRWGGGGEEGAGVAESAVEPAGAPAGEPTDEVLLRENLQAAGPANIRGAIEELAEGQQLLPAAEVAPPPSAPEVVIPPVEQVAPPPVVEPATNTVPSETLAARFARGRQVAAGLGQRVTGAVEKAKKGIRQGWSAKPPSSPEAEGTPAVAPTTRWGLGREPVVIPAPDEAVDRLAAGAAEKAASFYEASAAQGPAALAENLQVDQPQVALENLAGNGGVDLTGSQTGAEAAESVGVTPPPTEQSPAPPAAAGIQETMRPIGQQGPARWEQPRTSFKPSPEGTFVRGQGAVAGEGYQATVESAPPVEEAKEPLAPQTAGLLAEGAPPAAPVAEPVVEQEPPPPGAFAEMAENIATASARPSLDIPVRPPAVGAVVEPATPPQKEPPQVVAEGPAVSPQVPEKGPTPDEELRDRVTRQFLKEMRSELPGVTMTGQEEEITPEELATLRHIKRALKEERQKNRGRMKKPVGVEQLRPPVPAGEPEVVESTVVSAASPAPGEENVPVEKRSFLRKAVQKIINAVPITAGVLRGSFISYFKNLDLRQLKDPMWAAGFVAGGAVGITESLLVFEGPQKSALNAAFKVGLTMAVHTMAAGAASPEAEGLRRKVLLSKLEDFGRKHPKGVVMMQRALGGLSAGLTYSSLFDVGQGLLEAAKANIQEKVSEGIAPAESVQDLAKRIPTGREGGLPEYWGETSPPAELSSAPPAEAAAPAEVPAPAEAPTELSSAEAEATETAVNTVGDKVKEILAQDPSTFTETAITKGTTVGQMLTDAGHNLTWTGADADLLGAHIAANYDMLTESWQNMVDYGVIPEQPFPAELPELSDLVERAKADDEEAEEARKKLVEALHWIRAGDKIKILSQSGITQVLAALG